MRNVLLFSTSAVHGGAYMEYALPYMQAFLGDLAKILFIPYARPSGASHEEYSDRFRERVAPAGFEVVGIEEHADPRAAVADAEAIFVGGGNTFVLLSQLYAEGLLEPIRERVDAGAFYMGSSAGSNVAGPSIGTTNDMPIVHPPSLEALGLIPFNINPHYLDPDPDSTHMGETRETRIEEFHLFNAQPVVGLREGALLRISWEPAERAGSVELDGTSGARVFRRHGDPTEHAPGERLDELLA